MLNAAPDFLPCALCSALLLASSLARVHDHVMRARMCAYSNLCALKMRSGAVVVSCLGKLMMCPRYHNIACMRACRLGEK